MPAYNTVGFEATFSGTLVSGTPVAIPVDKGVLFNGPAFVAFTCQATITGVYQLLVNGMTMDIADPGEGHNQSGVTPSENAIYKLMAFPVAPYTLQFTPRISTGGALIVVRAIPNY